ncbi:MAG: hypothetical protein HYZ49_12445 [Chloroflexi bacterium]|nr:hypothetical protein [Chloroflexota bacterium]
MNCVSPPELDDRQLLTYVDGVAEHEVATHLERCLYCRDKARQLARLQDRLTARLYRFTCPSPIELGEYHLGLLASAKTMAVAQHLRECPHCARELVQLKNYLSDLEPVAEPGLLGRVKVLVARLVGGEQRGRPSGEPAFAPAFVAVRGANHGPITLEADGLLIVLDVQPATGGRVTILGQIAAEDQDQWTGAVVELSQGGALQMTTTVDDLGAFHCAGILPASTEIKIISSDGITVQIPTIDIAV